MSANKLSEYFTLAEMTRTRTGMPNVPGQAEVFALEALCENVLDKVRAHFGRPVIVNSGYRSPAVNKKVGGAASSQHVRGEAADIKVPGVPNADVWHFIVNELGEFDQCIAELLSETNPEAGWVHVSYRTGKNRRQALSFLGKGKYVTGFKYAS